MEQPSIVSSFSHACFDHSQHMPDVVENKIESKSSSEMEEKYFRCLDDFFSDMCSNYIEFGAQYKTFTRCIRLLLKISFPSQLFSSMFKRLRDVLHLLTFESELNLIEVETSAYRLKQSIWKTPSEPVFTNDPSNILDSFSIILCKPKDENSRGIEPDKLGFIYFLALGTIAKNVVALRMMAAIQAGV